MTSEHCPRCNSTNITGRGFDTGDGDEWQERYCFDCQHGEERLRSAGGVSWYAKPRKKHRDVDAEQRLLDEVYAAPDDDAPRSIYADWLIEQGDPRGTFIALQLARAANRDPVVSEEEQLLLDRHWRTWLGELRTLIGKKKHVEFERGFLSGCDGFETKPASPDVLVDPAWSTVRRLALTFSNEEDCRSLLGGPLRRSLRSFAFTGRAWLEAVARQRPPLHLEEIVLSFVTPDLFPLPRPAAFPHLRRIGVHGLPIHVVSWLDHLCTTGYRHVFVRCARLGDADVKVCFERARRTPGLAFELEEGPPTEGQQRCTLSVDGLLETVRTALPRPGFGARPR